MRLSIFALALSSIYALVYVFAPEVAMALTLFFISAIVIPGCIDLHKTFKAKRFKKLVP